jgi:hypothetical protein
MLAKVMFEIEAERGLALNEAERQTIAARIMSMASEGENDPMVIKRTALEALGDRPVLKTGS